MRTRSKTRHQKEIKLASKRRQRENEEFRQIEALRSKRRRIEHKKLDELRDQMLVKIEKKILILKQKCAALSKELNSIKNKGIITNSIERLN
jgi:hypothetical protein